MAKTKVSLQEAGAIRRFRSSADAQLIKAVIERELHLVRDEYEDNQADENTRKALLAVKQVLRLLYEDELERFNE